MDDDKLTRAGAGVGMAVATQSPLGAAKAIAGLFTTNREVVEALVEADWREWVEDQIFQQDLEFRERLRRVEDEAERQRMRLDYLEREVGGMRGGQAIAVFVEVRRAWERASDDESRLLVGAALRGSLFEHEKFGKHRKALTTALASVDHGDVATLRLYAAERVMTSTGLITAPQGEAERYGEPTMRAAKAGSLVAHSTAKLLELGLLTDLERLQRPRDPHREAWCIVSEFGQLFLEFVDTRA